MFGIFDTNYERNRVLREGFVANNFDVIECCVNPSKHRGALKYIALVQAWWPSRKEKFAYVVVCFPGHSIMWLGLLLFGRRVIFDAFLSLYDSNVYDRRVYSKYSFMALRDWFYDWYACALASVILLDTDQHRIFFNDTFKIPMHKSRRLFISADSKIFNPDSVRASLCADINKAIIVEFHGNFIPLHGLQYIINAAKILQNKNIEFNIIGSGQESGSIKKQVDELRVYNVQFFGRCSLEDIRLHVAKADICLGIFGNTKKAARVIPNKVFEALAMGKPIITMDSPASRELLTDGENALLCAPASGKAIADAINRLVEDIGLRERLGHNARRLYEHSLQPKNLIGDLIR